MQPVSADSADAGSSEPTIADLLRRIADASARESLAPDAKQVLIRIATAAVMLERLPQPGPELLILDAAVRAATNGSPDLALGITRELESSLRIRCHSLKSILKGRSAALPLFLGMVATIGLMPFLWAYMMFQLTILWKWSPNHFALDIDSGMLLFVAWAGGFGAEVSMMLRLPDYSTMARLGGPMAERQTLFIAGFFRPWIGVAFSLFVYMLLSSGIVKIGTAALSPLMYLSLAFVTGFSERLGPDFISRAEHTLQSAPPPGPGDTQAR